MNHNNQIHKLLKILVTLIFYELGGCLNCYNYTLLLPLLILLFQGRETTGHVVHKHRHVFLWHSSGVHI